jgi:hypothetical protein
MYVIRHQSILLNGTSAKNHSSSAKSSPSMVHLQKIIAIAQIIPINGTPAKKS